MTGFMIQPLMPLLSSGRGGDVGFGNEYISVGENIEPARMIETGRKSAHRKAGGSPRRLACRPAFGRGYIDGG